MGLSRKPHGRFPSFFAWRMVWVRLLYMAKIIMIGSISMDLEGFCITMGTILDFSKILFSPDVTGPALYTCVRFRSDPSRNHDGVRARGHKPYCFYSMIYDGPFSGLRVVKWPNLVIPVDSVCLSQS